MVLKGYTKRILRAENNPNLESLYCFAELEDDIAEVFPYLKKVFGEAISSEEIPFLALKLHGKKINLYPRRIVINALKNENVRGVWK